MVDESGSVGHDDFRVTMEYLANAVNRLPIRYDLLRIGLALFSGSTRKSFKLDDHFTKEHVTDAILKTYFGSGGTNIDGALGYTCDDMFQLTTGDRPYAQNILVLITDGQSSSANKPGLQKCKSKNVTIIGIGIGSSVDEQQLRSLVSKPEYYFDTTYDNLDTTLPKLIKTITGMLFTCLMLMRYVCCCSAVCILCRLSYCLFVCFSLMNVPACVRAVFQSRSVVILAIFFLL